MINVCVIIRNRGPRNGQEYGDNHFGGERGRRRRTDDYDTAQPLDKRLRLEGNAVGKGSPLVIGPRIRPRLSSEDDDQRGGGRRVKYLLTYLIMCLNMHLISIMYGNAIIS